MKDTTAGKKSAHERGEKGLPSKIILNLSIVFCLMLTTICATVTPAYAAGITFRDVPTSHWAYEYIMDIADAGLMGGTPPITSEGIGTFEPERVVTRAEFLTTLVRYAFGNELGQAETSGSKWWSAVYNVALKYGLLHYPDFDSGNLDVALTREEAAVLIRGTLNCMGNIPPSLVATSEIPDYDNYRNGLAIKFVYSMGIMSGTDSKGTFSGNTNLTRAQAATVLYRIITQQDGAVVELYKPDPNLTDWYRASSTYGGNQWSEYDAWCQNIDYSDAIDKMAKIDPNYLMFTRDGSPYDKRVGIAMVQSPWKIDIPDENQTWVEGKEHNIPQVGDVVIKDGKEIVLKLNHGILGFGQGVDIYTGTREGDNILSENSLSCFNARPLQFDPITNEMHSVDEWQIILSACKPQSRGRYEGEIRDNWYVWDSIVEEWSVCVPLGY